eukprot:scaffold77144_cov17-Tisochrysis_lutea.AAC.3
MALHQTGAKIGMACMLFLSFCGWVVSARVALGGGSRRSLLCVLRVARTGSHSLSCPSRELAVSPAGTPLGPHPYPHPPTHTYTLQVSIGGTAHATNECRENTDEWKENDTVGESGHLQPFPGDSADEDRAYDCDWWIIAFQVGERARARGLQHTATPTPHSPGKSCTNGATLNVLPCGHLLLAAPQLWCKLHTWWTGSEPSAMGVEEALARHSY